MKIADHLHLPVRMGPNRQDSVVNSFGVEVAAMKSPDYTDPFVRAVNCFDDLLAALKLQLAFEAALSGSPGHSRATWMELVKVRDAAIAKAEGDPAAEVLAQGRELGAILDGQKPAQEVTDARLIRAHAAWVLALGRMDGIEVVMTTEQARTALRAALSA